MSDELKVATDRLERVADQSRKLLNHLLPTSKLLVSERSESLFGCLGGLSAIAATVFVNAHVGMATAFLLDPTMVSGGIIAGILLYRGPRTVRLERRLKQQALEDEAQDFQQSKLDEQAKKLLESIKKLPAGTPHDVSQGMWKLYLRLKTEDSVKISGLLLDSPVSSSGQGPNQKQLPP